MMPQYLTANKIAARFREDIEFIKGWIKSPGAVGSIKPTGEIAARYMASLLPIEEGLPVLELGPGTGVITREILKRGVEPNKIVSIEYSKEFYDYLTANIPDVNFINGDAFDLSKTLKDVEYKVYAGVIGAIPLLNIPMSQREDVIHESLKLVAPNGPFIQISYGAKPPVPAVPGKFTVEKSDRIFRNIPPAGIWVYRRDMQ